MPGDTETFDPRFASLVLGNADLQVLGTGCRWLEGPVWFGDLDCLLVSDIPNDRILRWTESSGLTVFRQPSGFANGQTRDRQGRLLGCSHQNRCITRTELDGQVGVLASHFDGKRLNSPNDITCHSDGSIWFTDPVYGISTDYEGGKQRSEQQPRLYRFDPQTGALQAMADDLVGPNGVCFSPDEQRLYVTDTGRQFGEDPSRHIRVYDIDPANGHPVNGRPFHAIAPGAADGIRCDEDGNVWSSAGDGVHCIAPDGILLGKIKVPQTVSNIAFGGRHRSRLFICAGHTLYAIYTNQRGAARP